MYAINEVISSIFFLIDPSTGKPATGKTVTAIVYDETFTQFNTPAVTEIAGGLYYAQFTPDTAGVWAIKFSCTSPEQYGGLAFPVGLGNEALLANGTYGLAALNTDLDALLARLTATRAGYLDNLSGGAIALNADMATVLSRLSAARAGYLDNLSGGAVALASICTDVRLGELGAANLPADVDTLLARLSALRAGYLDNLSVGAVALEATLTAMKGAGWSTETLKAIKDAINTLLADHVVLLTDHTTLLTRLSATRAGYLDNLSAGAVALQSTLTALNNISTADVEGKVENAVDAGNLTHDITTVNDKTETQVVEIAKAGIYALSVFFDLDTLETATEGGTVKIRVYNKIDGANYSDKPSAYAEYVVGQENEYPSIEINLVHGYCKVTIQCSTDVTATRTIAYRHLERDLGA